MALYAFDGTGNEDDTVDEPGISEDSNVRNFFEAYTGPKEYLAGIGTRFGVFGRFFGGLFGAGGKTRIEEMHEKLEKNWNSGDQIIDIIGFSRGAALAVHFANVVENTGIKQNGDTVYPEIRFLGLWDIVGAFGIPRDIVFKFQDLNIGYDLTLSDKVQHSYHAMSMNERRDCFKVTRLNNPGEVGPANEMWFRGVHSDVGGGRKNGGLENISLFWMLTNAKQVGLPIDEAHLNSAESHQDKLAPISHNQDIIIGPRRRVRDNDKVHPSAIGRKLGIGDTEKFAVDSRQLFNWSGVYLEQGGYYSFEPEQGQVWKDGSIECDAAGWETEELPWLKENIFELFENSRRCPDADWFELIGALGDDDKKLFRIGAGGGDKTYQAVDEGELYAFANDLLSKYSNNQGYIEVTVKRVQEPGVDGNLRPCS